MESTRRWASIVEDIATYLIESNDPESLIKMYESVFPNTKVIYEGDSIFTVRSEP